jgi:hypothetical protein
MSIFQKNFGMCPIPGDVYEKYVNPGSSNCTAGKNSGIRILPEERSYKDVRFVPEKVNKNASVEVLKVECDRAYSEWQCMIQYNAGELAIVAMENRYREKKRVLDLLVPSLPVLFAKNVIVCEKNYSMHLPPVDVCVETIDEDLPHESVSVDDIDFFKEFFYYDESTGENVLEFIDQDFVNAFFSGVDVPIGLSSDTVSLNLEEPEGVQIAQFESVRIEENTGKKSSIIHREEIVLDESIFLSLNETNSSFSICLPVCLEQDVKEKYDIFFVNDCRDIYDVLVDRDDSCFEGETCSEEDFKCGYYVAQKELGEIFGSADVGELCLVGGVRIRRKKRRKEKILMFYNAPSCYIFNLDYIDHSPYRKSDIGGIGWSYSSDLLAYSPFKNKGQFGRDFRYLSSLYGSWMVKQIKVFCDFNSGARPSVYSLIGNSNGDPQFVNTTYKGFKDFVFDSGEPDRFVAPYSNFKSSYYMNSRYFGSRTKYRDMSGTVDSSPVKKYSVSIVAFDPQGPDLLEIYPLIRVKFVVEWSMLRDRPLDMSWYDETLLDTSWYNET